MAKNRKRKKSKPLPKPVDGKKEFKRKLLRLARASNAEEGYYLIPPQLMDTMYHTRFRSIRIETDDTTIPPNSLKEAQKHLDKLLKKYHLTIVEDGEPLPLKEYIPLATTLVYSITSNTHIPKKELLLEKFATLVKAVEEDLMLLNLLGQTSWEVSSHICRINRRFYWFEYHPVYKNNKLYDCLYMHSQEAEKIHLTLNKIGRTAFRIGFPTSEEGVEWASVTRKDLGIEGPYANAAMGVYIQSHAINRLKERIDCVGTSLLHFYLFASLENLKVQKVNGHILIEYRLKDFKVGYLVFDLIKDKLIIKTFLFITMDGTPEGEQLRDMWGIEAVDKKYLEIDRLSTFVLSDIKDNQELRDQFIVAGCEDLFIIGEGALDLEIDMKKASEMEAYLKVPAETVEENAIC